MLVVGYYGEIMLLVFDVIICCYLLFWVLLVGVLVYWFVSCYVGYLIELVVLNFDKNSCGFLVFVVCWLLL